MQTIAYGKDYYEFCKNKQGFDMKAKGGWQREYVNYIRSLFNLKNTKCLDFGCAMGSMASAFNDSGVDMVGVDVDKFYVDQCPFGNLKGKMFTYTDKLPFKDEEFDFIHSSQVIEHIPADKLMFVLAELRRVLKKNGVIYFSTCGNEIHDDDKDDPTHIPGLNRTSWFKMFDESKFENITSQTESCWVDHPMFQQYNWVQFVLKRPEVDEVKEELPFTEPIPIVEEPILPENVTVPVSPLQTHPSGKKRGRSKR